MNFGVHVRVTWNGGVECGGGRGGGVMRRGVFKFDVLCSPPFRLGTNWRSKTSSYFCV